MRYYLLYCILKFISFFYNSMQRIEKLRLNLWIIIFNLLSFIFYFIVGNFIFYLFFLMNKVTLEPKTFSPIFDKIAPTLLLNIKDQTFIKCWKVIQTLFHFFKHVECESFFWIFEKESFLDLVSTHFVQKVVVKRKTKLRILRKTIVFLDIRVKIDNFFILSYMGKIFPFFLLRVMKIID